MSLLLVMSAVTLMIVDSLIRSSVWQIMFETWPGRITLGVVVSILLLFARKVYEIDH